jgi:peptide/nickel transport system substrate-binding protein
LQPNPDWLAGAPDVESDPTTRVTYHLNPAAVWGDGEPITVADFQATWQACADPPEGQACRSGTGFDAIASIEPGNHPTDIVVTYTAPYPDWPFTFRYGPARADETTDLWATWDNPAAHREALCGPFTIVAADPDRQGLTLVANPYWWGQPPKLSSITVTHLDPADLPGSLTAEQYDAWPLGLAANAYTAASLAPGLQLRRGPSTEWRVLLFNQTTAPLDDRRVRQAIAAALDRATIGLADLPGLDWSATPQNALAWQPTQPAYIDLAEQTGLTYDLAAAGDLLDSVGWTLSDEVPKPDDGKSNVREQDGVRLTVRFGVVADDPLSESEGLQVRAQLAALGVAVTLVPIPSVTGTPLAELGVDLLAVPWTNDLHPAQRLAAEFTTGVPGNITGYANSTVDTLLGTAVRTLDAEAQANLVNAASTTLWRDVVALPLYITPDLWAMVPHLANVGPSGLATLHWENVGFTR